MRERSREEHIEMLTAAMRERFGAHCDVPTIASMVTAEYDDLCQKATIRDYIPIIAERGVRRRLALRCTELSDTLAAQSRYH